MKDTLLTSAIIWDTMTLMCANAEIWGTKAKDQKKTHIQCYGV